MSATVSAQPPRKPGLFSRLGRDPNALWMREMRQSARLGRTPWVLFSLTLLIALVMCSSGAIAAANGASPAKLGEGLFQGFFSLAYFVVIIAGPTIAANSIASEREGRTWEAVQLTGLHAKDIARGKFMAAYTSLGLYIVVIAPVGALPFLFGGVTAIEVVVAFVFLFIVAALAVAFGLAISSQMSSLRGAIVVTLMLALLAGPTLYGIFGVAASTVLHTEWSSVPEGFPVWLPLAYTRAPFGLEYVLVLIAMPLLLLLLPAWLLFEFTTSNLTGETDDRATGLKRWYALSTPLVASMLSLAVLLADDGKSRIIATLAELSAFACYFAVCALMFSFDTAGPSRRVEVHWARDGAGAVRRFFGPGIGRTTILLLVLGLVGLAQIVAVGVMSISLAASSSTVTYGGLSTDGDVRSVLAFAAYAAGFAVFTAGLLGWLRARGSSPWGARFVGIAAMFAISAAPWLVAAIGGIAVHGADDWLIAGAPSPFFAFLMVDKISRASSSEMPFVPAGLACALGWGLLGLMLVGAAVRRCAQAIRAQREAIAQTEAALRAEDEAIAAHAAAATT